MGTAGYISTVVLFLLGGVILGMVLAGKKEAVIFRGRRTAGRAGGNVLASQLIRQHFHPAEPESLEISERVFPIRVRPDLQRVLDRLTTGDNASGRFFAVHRPHQYESIGFTGLIIRDDRPAIIVPPKYEEVDVGEDEPVRCLQNGVWLLERIGTRYAVLCEPAQRFHQVSGVRFQIATTVDATSPAIVEAFFNELEQAVRRAHSYRGKILSLTESQPYSGLSSGIMVHRLRRVDREQVILPSATLALLDRNVIDFARRRAELTRFGQSIKKGLLLYGPPGTGKTHTIHYLAAALEGHTTLLITAEQVALLPEYMTLARLLQPSVVVIEDVDLIARDRRDMNSPCEEVMLTVHPKTLKTDRLEAGPTRVLGCTLNKLLNEMDGLTEDAEIIFLLTTNRPEGLEAALTSRPGRIDQAIEFPLPDAVGREKLVRLYSQGINLAGETVSAVVKRTERVSGAFIKELMRRSTQFHIERNGDGCVSLEDVDNALDEMLFRGGSLNVKLLGGRVAEAT